MLTRRIKGLGCAAVVGLMLVCVPRVTGFSYNTNPKATEGELLTALCIAEYLHPFLHLIFGRTVDGYTWQRWRLIAVVTRAYVTNEHPCANRVAA